ncbi:MAG: ABC transporter permease [Peptostreptococcaceae bacterium]|nr:ABC transporter permease [Peptostreptococcaceae bacterium]
MAGFRATIYKDLKLFYKGFGWAALLLPFVMMFFMYWAMDDFSSQNFVKPFPIAVRDLDQSFMSRSLISQIRQVELFSEVSVLKEDAAPASDVVAVVTIPKDFFYDAYAFRKNPIQILLYNESRIEASIFRSVFTSIMDIMRTEQAVGLSIYQFAYGKSLSPQLQNRMISESGAQLLESLLSRQNHFDEKVIPSQIEQVISIRLIATLLSIVALLAGFVAARSIPQEIRLGVLARYKALGGRSSLFMLSKLSVALLFSSPTLFLCFLMMQKIGMLSLKNILLISMIYILALSSAFCLMLAIVFWAKNSVVASQISNFVILVSILLGGTIFPTNRFPYILHYAGKLTLGNYILSSLEAMRTYTDAKTSLMLLAPFVMMTALSLLIAVTGRWLSSKKWTWLGERKLFEREKLEISPEMILPATMSSEVQDDIPDESSETHFIDGIVKDSLRDNPEETEHTHSSLANWKKSSELSRFIDDILDKREIAVDFDDGVLLDEDSNTETLYGGKKSSRNPKKTKNHFTILRELTQFKLFAAINGWYGLIGLILLSALLGNIIHATQKTAVDTVHIMIVDRDDGELSEELVQNLSYEESLRIEFADESTARYALIVGDAEGVLWIEDGFSEKIREQEPALHYESASPSFSAQGIREIIAAQVIQLRSKMQAERQTEEKLARSISGAERENLQALIENNIQSFRKLYEIESVSGGAVREPFVPKPISLTALCNLLTLLSIGAYFGNRDSRQIRYRFASIPKGEWLFYMSDFIALNLVGVIMTLFVLAFAKSMDFYQILAGITYNACSAAAVLWITQIISKEGRVDITAVFVALIVCLIGGCFVDLSIANNIQQWSLLSPAGQMLYATQHPIMNFLLLGESVFFILIGLKAKNASF